MVFVSGVWMFVCFGLFVLLLGCGVLLLGMFGWLFSGCLLCWFGCCAWLMLLMVVI